MKTRSLVISILGCALSPSCFARNKSQGANDAQVASVHVLAFDTEGTILEVPHIVSFESEEGKADLADRFRAGVAHNIPFGTYRIEAYATAYYRVKRYVKIYQHQATVVLGLVSGLNEATPIPLKIEGFVNIDGQFKRGSFVKAVGVLADSSQEAIIDEGGQFSFAGLSAGRYLLLVISGGAVVASRPVQIPYRGSAIRIDVTSERIK